MPVRQRRPRVLWHPQARHPWPQDAYGTAEGRRVGDEEDWQEGGPALPAPRGQGSVPPRAHRSQRGYVPAGEPWPDAAEPPAETQTLLGPGCPDLALQARSRARRPSHPVRAQEEWPRALLGAPAGARRHPEAHLRGADVPGAGTGGGARRRRFRAGRGRRLQARDDQGPRVWGDGRNEAEVPPACRRPRRAKEDGGHGLRLDGGLRLLRFPESPRGLLRAPLLRERLHEGPLPGRVLLRPAQLPADGLLQPQGPAQRGQEDRPRSPPARRLRVG